MTAHLTDKAMTDVLEGGGSPVEWAHVAACPECRSRLDEARRGRDLAGRADVPEPPGMYWEALRRNVGRRISEEAAGSQRGRWGWLAPLAASAAVLGIVMVFVVGHGEAPAPQPSPVAAWSALPPVEEDEGLAVLTGLATTDPEVGWTSWEEGRGLGAFVAGLSDEESEALVAALRVERPEGDL
jgi:hypothetical protein